MLVAGVIVALAGAMPLVPQTSAARDRHVRPTRTGQFRQADGVEEFIPRAFEPLQDYQTDLVLVRDSDERGIPYRAAPLVASEAFLVSFARTSGTLVPLVDDTFPIARPPAPRRGRAPPPASI